LKSDVSPVAVADDDDSDDDDELEATTDARRHHSLDRSARCFFIYLIISVAAIGVSMSLLASYEGGVDVVDRPNDDWRGGVEDISLAPGAGNSVIGKWSLRGGAAGNSRRPTGLAHARVREAERQRKEKEKVGGWEGGREQRSADQDEVNADDRTPSAQLVRRRARPAGLVADKQDRRKRANR
jgi:hypothetical protein